LYSIVDCSTNCANPSEPRQKYSFCHFYQALAVAGLEPANLGL
jgi:hypothetical protein